MKRREFLTLIGGAALSKGMEKTMRRFTLLVLVALLGGADRMAAQETVETTRHHVGNKSRRGYLRPPD
jgi:hypothetical protein